MSFVAKLGTIPYALPPPCLRKAGSCRSCVLLRRRSGGEPPLVVGEDRLSVGSASLSCAPLVRSGLRTLVANVSRACLLPVLPVVAKPQVADSQGHRPLHGSTGARRRATAGGRCNICVVSWGGAVLACPSEHLPGWPLQSSRTRSYAYDPHGPDVSMCWSGCLTLCAVALGALGHHIVAPQLRSGTQPFQDLPCRAATVDANRCDIYERRPCITRPSVPHR